MICCLFAEGGGILRDHELLVGRDDPDLDLGVVGRDDGLFAAGLVLLRVELDAEVLQAVADGRAHGAGVLADTGRKDEAVEAFESGGISADVLSDFIGELIERQLRGLNEKLEQTLTEKRDAEHFLRVLAPKFKSVFVVDLKTDRMRGVIVPDYFQKILDTSGGSFLAVLQQYRDTQVQPAYRESLADLLDYNYIRSKVLTGDIVEHTYKKTDGTTFRVKVTPYSRSGSHIDETLWIFSDEGASLTPPQTK